MAAKAQGPKVSAVVNEEKGTVAVGVEHDGAFLTVATASLDYAKSLNLDASGEPSTDDNTEGEG